MPVIVDIEALKNAEQALRESEIRMRALLDASQDEILLVSTDGTVLAINKAARARLAKRIADSDPIGARLDQLLPKDLAELRLTVVQQVAATATLAHLEQQIGARWFEWWFYPVVRPDGGLGGSTTRRGHSLAGYQLLWKGLPIARSKETTVTAK